MEPGYESTLVESRHQPTLGKPRRMKKIIIPVLLCLFGVRGFSATYPPGAILYYTSANTNAIPSYVTATPFIGGTNLLSGTLTSSNVITSRKAYSGGVNTPTVWGSTPSEEAMVITRVPGLNGDTGTPELWISRNSAANLTSDYTFMDLFPDATSSTLTIGRRVSGNIVSVLMNATATRPSVQYGITGTGSSIDTSGSGTPEGAVTAAVGSTYRRWDGGASTTFYAKTSGSGNTGWTALSAGSSGTTGTVINTGTPAVGNVPAYSDTTGTNVGPFTALTLTSTNASLTGKLSANGGAFTNTLTLNGTTVSTFTGTAGTVIGSGTTAANDIAVFTDTTHTNIARSTSAGTLGDNSSSTYALTINLSGTDPIWSYSSGVANLSAGALQVGGVAVSTATGANPSASVGLAAVNGSAATWMRSDGAPALSQAIVPTWTGAHIFNAGSGVPVTIQPGSADTKSLVVQGGSVTGAGTTPMVDLSWIWNTSGAADGFLIHFTNTASGSSKPFHILGGAAGATELLNVDKSGNISTPGSVVINPGSAFSFSGGSKILSSTDGTAYFRDNASSGAFILGIGGISSSFPALKRSGTTIQFRLADDSGNANVLIGGPNDTTALTVNGGSVTGSGTTSLIDLSGTWNTSGSADFMSINVTNTASGGSANLLNLKVGGSSVANIRKDGWIVSQFGVGTPTLYTASGGSVATLGTVSGVANSFSIANTLGLNGATLLSGEASAVLQLGIDAATATDQVIKSADGLGTDKTGAALTIAGGQSTGTGAPGKVLFKRGTVSTTGSSANAYGTSVSAGGTLDVNTTTTGNIGAGEDNLITYSIPAAQMSVNKDRIEFDCAGTFAATINAKTLKFYFGATAIFNSSSLVLNGVAWRVHGVIIRTSATTQKSTVEATIGGTLLSAVNSTVTQYTTPAETMSGAITFKGAGSDDGGVPADNAVVEEMSVVKFHFAP